jgi:hypothetical protein
MGDMGDFWRDVKDSQRERKAKHGIACPGCREKFPKAPPKILLPGQKCFCGYRDTRPRIKED